MLIDILFFIINNLGLMLIGIVLLMLLCSWVTMFINKDYKFIRDHNNRYSSKVLNLKDLDKLKYEIEHMEGRQFEIFCEWLFNNIGKYKSVTLTAAVNDEGRDLILVDENDRTIFVECKRYTENATVTEEFMIGREICQKLVGAIVAEGITNGIIITTGNIHQNAWDYIVKLEKNSDVRLEIITLNEIMRMVEEINKSEVLQLNYR